MQISPPKSTRIVTPSVRALSVFAVLATTFLVTCLRANRPLRAAPVSDVRDANVPRTLEGGSVMEDKRPPFGSNTSISNVFNTADSASSNDDHDDSDTIPATTDLETVQNLQNTPACGHMLVFTGPRHGSTWFVNNIENCTYSQPDGTFGDLFAYSELWVGKGDRFVNDLTVNEAIEWLGSNASLKMFPVAWNKRQPFASELVLKAHAQHIPIVLLARDVRNAFRSMLVSKETGRWKENAVHSQNPQRHQNDLDEFDSVVDDLIRKDDPKWRFFKYKMTSHLNAARDFLNSKQIPFDLVTYDDFVDIESVALPNAKCVIRNCNFV